MIRDSLKTQPRNHTPLLAGLLLGLLVLLVMGKALAAAPPTPDEPPNRNESETPDPAILKPLAETPHQYMHLPQALSNYPKVYCGPTVIAMGYSPYYRDWAYYHPEAYIENWAKHLKTSETHGTNAAQMLAALEYFDLYHDMGKRWDGVGYQGIHNVPEKFYDTPGHGPTAPDANHWMRNELARGSMVIAHLGWYKPDDEAKTLRRHGGHYVLVTGVYQSEEQPGYRYIQMLDSLHHKTEKPARDPGHTRHTLLALRPFDNTLSTYTLEDPDGQFPPQKAGDLLYQPEATPGKEDDVLPVLEGVFILKTEVF